MTIPVTVPRTYFDAMYQDAADPWGFEDRWYEQRKYSVSLAMLPAVRYHSALEPEGTLLAVHWRHPVADYPRSGDDVHRVLADCPGLGRLVRHTEPDFLAEVYIRTDATPVSVAQATGLV